MNHPSIRPIMSLFWSLMCRGLLHKFTHNSGQKYFLQLIYNEPPPSFLCIIMCTIRATYWGDFTARRIPQTTLLGVP
uniref:Secreted protein n=1 Tax=Lutzomyia longipalpis TaxID=7200 RepID=A0A1B0CMA3_LUTLO